MSKKVFPNQEYLDYFQKMVKKALPSGSNVQPEDLIINEVIEIEEETDADTDTVYCLYEINISVRNLIIRTKGKRPGDHSSRGVE